MNNAWCYKVLHDKRYSQSAKYEILIQQNEKNRVNMLLDSTYYN